VTALTPDALVHVALIEVALFGVLAVLALAARERAEFRRSRSVRRIGHLQDGLVSGSARAVHAFGRLPRSQQPGAAAMLARNLSGAERRRIAGWAETSGLLGRAERWSASRRWHRRLRGVRLFTALAVGADQVLPRLADGDARVRVAATQLAVELAQELGDAELERLTGLLGDRDPGVRFAAGDALCRLAQRAVRPIADVLADPAAGGPLLRSALQVAVVVVDPAYLSSALRLSAHPDPDVRRGAVPVLSHLGGGEASSRLAVLLDDVDAGVRAASAEGLGRLGRWQSAAALGRGLRDLSWDVRRASGLALLRLFEPGELVLLRALHDHDRFAADMARLALSSRDRHRV
jgi:hypothetical protein